MKFYKYSKSTNENSSPKELLKDLRIRAGHYSREANKIARNNLRINKILTYLSFLISSVMTAILSFYQSEFLNNRSASFFLVVGSFLVAVISITQVIIFDAKVSAKCFQISQIFFEIKEEVKIFLSENLDMKNDANKKYLMEKYVLSIEKYSKARESFVEYMSRHSSYYGAGKIQNLELIKMNAIDIDDNEIFE